MSKALRGVLFDMGGTLFHHLPADVTRDNLLRAARAAGIDAPDSAIHDTFAAARASVDTAFAARPFYRHRELVADAFRAGARAFGIEAPEEVVSDWCDSQRDSVVSSLQLRRDCIETLKTLRREGCWVAIVSNIDDDWLDPLLARAGLTDLLDHWLSSEAAGSCKPDHAIFDQAVARSREPADALLYVGDSPLHDVAGAHAAGLATALLDVDLLGHVHVPVAPDWRISSLAGVVPIARGHRSPGQ